MTLSSSELVQQLDAPRLYLDALGEQVANLAELEAALKPRLEVTSERYARFLALDDETLAAAALTTQRAVDFLQRALLSLRDDDTQVERVMSEVPRTFFTEDHAWRLLFDELRQMDSRYGDFKLLALARYRGYLVGCLNALNRVSDERLHSAIGGHLRSASEHTTEYLMPRARSYDSTRSSSDGILRDLVRLPAGVTVSMQSDLDGAIDIWLGKRRFRLETWAGLQLVDERGRLAPLVEGRNVIGRGLSNNVVVHAGFRDVSRRHLIVDVRGGMPVALTDLSTLGTFVPRARLGRYQSQLINEPAPPDLA